MKDSKLKQLEEVVKRAEETVDFKYDLGLPGGIEKADNQLKAARKELERYRTQLAKQNGRFAGISEKVAKSITGGTVRRTLEGRGWTEKEALDSAMSMDEEEYGHGEGYGGGYNSMRGIVKKKRIRAPKNRRKLRFKRTVSQRDQ